MEKTSPCDGKSEALKSVLDCSRMVCESTLMLETFGRPGRAVESERVSGQLVLVCILLFSNIMKITLVKHSRVEG